MIQNLTKMSLQDISAFANIKKIAELDNFAQLSNPKLYIILI